ncbi:unnamed protein product [Echinostoma caproni]|uniref:Fibrous sheath CABYR-binding protein-like n=1 Tax=Echinostoma caproni TaxID=27848 RepID=A0A183B1Q6_9TREM|nr:unnamed protein product [Echinostoma caproni]
MREINEQNELRNTSELSQEYQPQTISPPVVASTEEATNPIVTPPQPELEPVVEQTDEPEQAKPHSSVCETLHPELVLSLSSQEIPNSACTEDVSMDVEEVVECENISTPSQIRQIETGTQTVSEENSSGK